MLHLNHTQAISILFSNIYGYFLQLNWRKMDLKNATSAASKMIKGTCLGFIS